ncbi:hypothetical protein HY772_09640, partial [Candidatus Woesearchaeota archaeon]|nr:hypothetical protein [Candidatus Woesearchaeota archaeon]
MIKVAKILLAVAGFCLGLTTFSFAAYDNSVYFRKNVTFSGSDSTGLGTQPTSISDASSYTIGTDTLYVELWEKMTFYFGAWWCFCCVPDQSATVTSNAVSGGMSQDSQALTLKDYVYAAAQPDTSYSTEPANPAKFINASPGVTLTLGTSTTPSNASALELEDGQTLTIGSYICPGPRDGTGNRLTDTATDTATVSVASDDVDSNDLVVRTDTSFASGSITTGYLPGTSSIYIQLTDTNCNKKG